MVKTRVSMIVSGRHLQREDMFVVTESDRPSKSVCVCVCDRQTEREREAKKSTRTGKSWESERFNFEWRRSNRF